MRDDVCFWIARHLPRRLVYWCAVRLMAHGAAANPTREVPAMTGIDYLMAWRKR
jgi:hypothetical protein